MDRIDAHNYALDNIYYIYYFIFVDFRFPAQPKVSKSKVKRYHGLTCPSQEGHLLIDKSCLVLHKINKSDSSIQPALTA